MYRILKQIARTGIVSEPPPAPDESLRMREALQQEIRALLGRALCIRHVDAGSCNGCELEIRADGVRFLTQAPTDLFGETTKMGWSWTGDFVPPTNRLGGKNIPDESEPAYKLAAG